MRLDSATDSPQIHHTLLGDQGMQLARGSQPSFPLPLHCEMGRTASVGTPTLEPRTHYSLWTLRVLSDKPLGATRARNGVCAHRVGGCLPRCWISLRRCHCSSSLPGFPEPTTPSLGI